MIRDCRIVQVSVLGLGRYSGYDVDGVDQLVFSLADADTNGTGQIQGDCDNQTDDEQWTKGEGHASSG